jgi:hypothetical protein
MPRVHQCRQKNFRPFLSVDLIIVDLIVELVRHYAIANLHSQRKMV